MPSNRDSLTAGPRGPLLAQDGWLNEKIANFLREVIPERRMHAKGSGAFGTFTVIKDIAGILLPPGGACRTSFHCTTQAQRIGHHRNRAQAHRQCRKHRVEQEAEGRIQQAHRG